MEKETRKASEVLLNVENMLTALLSMVEAQNLTIKILSNKLNSLIEKSNTSPSKIIVEAVNTAPNAFNKLPDIDAGKSIPITSESNLSMELSPNGFRRTSRPETYAGDNSYLSQEANLKGAIKYPPQIPVITDKKTEPAADNTQKNNQTKLETQQNKNVVPVSQRVVDSTGKSVFLAEVEVVDLSTMESVFKTRTNGTGKWSAPLTIGTYRVSIRKRDLSTKEKVETNQDVQIDGIRSPLELPTLIIRK